MQTGELRVVVLNGADPDHDRVVELSQAVREVTVSR